MEHTNTISIILNVALTTLCVLLLWLLLKRQPFNCNNCSQVVRVTVDTIRVKDTTPKLVKYHQPNPVKAVAIKTTTTVVNNNTTATIPLATPCDSVYYYADTLYRADDYNLIITDTVAGNQIAGRAVLFANLQPQIVKTVERVLPEKIKLYAGAAFTINAAHNNRWGLGPAAVLTIPRLGAVSYYYDAHNNAHSGALLMQIPLGKK